MTPVQAAVLRAMQPGREYTMPDLERLTGMAMPDIARAISAIIDSGAAQIRRGSNLQTRIYCLRATGAKLGNPRRLTAKPPDQAATGRKTQDGRQRGAQGQFQGRDNFGGRW